MPAITSLDLSNAKLDVDHIAAIATSTLPTATDRKGNTKDTISGAIYSIKSFNDRGTWTSATSYIIKDLVKVSDTWYVAVVPHTSSATFAEDLSTKWRIYQGVLAGDLSATTGADGVGTLQSGVGTVPRTVAEELRDTVSVKQFDTPGGGADSTAGFIRALNHVAITGQSLEAPTDNYLLSGPVTARLNGVVFNGNGSTIILDSNTAGFLIAGSYNEINGFKFTQSSQSLTPTAIKVFNDTTTPLSIHNKIKNCTGPSIYRGIHVYMALNGSGQACYRQIIDNCEFINKYLQKTWSGSFGISFDGPNSGDAGGNDSRVFNTVVGGYERNYIVNNSVTTQFTNCSGDGAANCFSYQGGASGIQIIGGYYEYNDTFMETVGTIKYDAYFLYPSYANNTTFMTGAGISLFGGGMPFGAPVAFMRNGFFGSILNTGIAEIDAANGTNFYSNNSRIVRLSLDPSGDWIFKNGRTLFDTSSGVYTDKIQGYSGGSVPLDLNSANNITLTTQGVERLRVNSSGNIVSLGPYNNTTASASNMYVAPDGSFQRSTSSEKYKYDIEDLSDTASDVLYSLEPIWFRSTCDRADWSWYGFSAEKAAKLDPRLVHWGYSKYIKIEVVPAVEGKSAVLDEHGNTIIPEVCSVPAQYKVEPDKNSELIPEGFQYDRLTVLLTDKIKKHHVQIKDLTNTVQRQKIQIEDMLIRLDKLEFINKT